MEQKESSEKKKINEIIAENKTSKINFLKFENKKFLIIKI